MKKLIAAMLGFGLILSGCSQPAPETKQGNESAVKEEPKVNTQPVTLNLFLNQTMTDEEFQLLVKDPVSKKYPNITLTFSRSGKGNTLEDVISSQTPLDIVYYTSTPQVLTNYNLPLDLRDLIKKENVDLSSIDPYYMDAVKKLVPSGEIYEIPFVSNTFAMFYNKDLFDKFGVAYPKDGMLWDDAIALAKPLSRTDGGVQYRGLDPYILGSINRIAKPYSLTLVDPKTNHAVIDPQWNKTFQWAMDVYNIPGNRPKALADPTNAFVKDRVLAMDPNFYSTMLAQLPGATGLNWDVVQLPSFPDRRDMAISQEFHGFVISKASKYPEQAMQVIKTVIANDNQKTAASIGRIPTSTNPDVRNAFGTKVPAFQGKNLAGILKSHQAPPPVNSEYDGIVKNQIEAAFKKVFSGDADINTALREAGEKATQAISTELTK